ncbi:MAG: hypothetical protein HZC55_10220 [Verrucomicrobia bacterium]|nr:hypothetical protein [Verrucomicrobiota bacterium]
MRPFAKLSALFCGLLATTSLLAGFEQLASRIDPVCQHAQSIAATDELARPEDPCVACYIDPE